MDNLKTNKLVRDIDKSCGTKAQSIYDWGCEKFGWKRSKRDGYGLRKRLCELNSTPEGYAVWFLTHSNWSNTEGKTWNNQIIGDRIEEKWENINSSTFFHDTNKRVTFVKKDGVYVFIGVYKCVSIKYVDEDYGQKKAIKIYQKVSDVYPD